MTINDIKDKLLQSGSTHQGDTQIPVIEDGLYIIQHIDEYAEYILNLSNNYTSFNNCVFIGIGSGGKIKIFCDLFECNNVLAIDDGSFDLAYKHWSRIKNTIKCNLVEIIADSNSDETISKIECFSKEFKGIDYAFVDGNHEEQYVKNDFINLDKHMNSNSIISFHDTTMGGPQAAIEELKKSCNYNFFSENKIKYGITSFKKIMKNEEVKNEEL